LDWERVGLSAEQQKQLFTLQHSILWRMLPRATKAIVKHLGGKGPWYFGGTAGANYYLTAGGPSERGLPILTDDWDLRLKCNPKAPATPPGYVKRLADELVSIAKDHFASLESCPLAKLLQVKFGNVHEPEEGYGYRLRADLTVMGKMVSWKFCDLSTKWKETKDEYEEKVPLHSKYERSLHVTDSESDVWHSGMSFMGPHDVEKDLQKTWQPHKKGRREKTLSYWLSRGGADHFAAMGDVGRDAICEICAMPCRVYQWCSFCSSGPVSHHGRCCPNHPGQ
jgi:hypothetical protein